MRNVAIFSLVWVLSSVAVAQTAAPLSGRIFESRKPLEAPRAPDKKPSVLEIPDTTAGNVPAGGIQFTLEGVSFEGNTSIDSVQLAALLSPMVGREVTLADLHAMATTIASYYAARGLLLVQAVVPPQKVTDGHVRFQVVEGFIDRVYVIDPAPVLADSTALGYLAGVQQQRPVLKGSLERPLLLINRLPGVSVRAVLEPGAVPESSSLGLSLSGDRGRHGNFFADNFGGQATGEARVGMELQYAGLMGKGDQLGVSLLTSEGTGIESGGVDYSVPLGHAGWLLETELEHMTYTLGDPFASLDAHGEANNASLKIAYPLELTDWATTEVWAAYQYRGLRDVIDAVGSTNRRNINRGEMGITRSGFDDWGGWNYAMLSYAVGELDMEDPAARAADVYGQNGFFSKANVLLTRQQRLTGSLGLNLLLQGQYAWQNLDSGEKFSLGGPYSVRAYPVSELSGDNGWLAQCALQWYANDQVTLSVFSDRGYVRFNANELQGNPWVEQYLRSAGVGFDWQGPYGFEFHASWAWAGSYASTSDKGNTDGRFYGVLRKRF